MDYSVYHAEGGWESGCAPSFQGTHVVCHRSHGTHRVQLGGIHASNIQGSANKVSGGRAKAVWIWFHFILLLLRPSTTDETSGGLQNSESVGPMYAEVGLDHGSYRSR